MDLLHILLGISNMNNVTRAEVKTRITQTIGPFEYLLFRVKRFKLMWYRHVTRSSEFAKTVIGGGKKPGQTEEKMGG